MTVKLSQLRLSPLNTRRVKPSAINSMADDIAAHGLLQNLLAYEEDELFWVFAGGRRYRALKELVKRKKIANSDPFPIELRTKAEAIELSYAENAAREDMLGQVAKTVLYVEMRDRPTAVLTQRAGGGRPVEEMMASRFASLPTEGRFEAIRAMAGDDKMALLAGLVAVMLDGTVFAGGWPSERHHHFEQIAKASGVNIAERWTAPIALFDRMKRASLITLLRQETGDASADNCATIKKKADLAVNVSGRLPGNWLPDPLRIGAFDMMESRLGGEADMAVSVDAEEAGEMA